MSSSMPESQRPLSYRPHWYEIGDAEQPQFALLYGLIAMGTVWLIEAIVSHSLSCRGRDVTMSEIATFMSLKGASWMDLAQMSASERWHGIPKAENFQPNSVFSTARRPVLGIFLRIFVIAAEVAVIFSAVPTSSDVLESQVGSSQLTFRKSSRTVDIQTLPSLDRYPVPCLQDLLQYEGFNPTVSRDICWHQIGKQGDRQPHTFTVAYSTGRNRIEIVSGDQEQGLAFGHYLRSSNTSFYALPMAPDILEQVDKILRDAYSFGRNGRRCEFSKVKKNTGPVKYNYDTILGECTKVPQVIQVYRLLMHSCRTEESKASAHKVTFEGKPVPKEIKIGKASRPRLCIYPALILLLSLAVVHGLLLWFWRSESVEMKLFRHMQALSGQSLKSSPFGTLNVVLPPPDSSRKGATQVCKNCTEATFPPQSPIPFG